MKWNVIRVMGAAMLLAACSNDEVIDVKQDPITFNVTTENVARSRAVSISTSTNLENFTLYADYTAPDKTTSSTYIFGDILEKGTDGKWGVVGGDRYWPADGTLNFYAVANNDEKSFDFTKKEVTHTVNDDVAKQTDLLYAVTTEMTKSSNATNGVTLNFRHALSQIAFKAKCLNEHLKVTISGVKLANVKGSGTFKFPDYSTTPNYTTASTADPESTTVGSWTFAKDVAETSIYSYAFTKELKGKNESAVDLSAMQKDSKDVDDNYMLLIPQKTTAWDKTTAISTTADDGTTTYAEGSYLAVECIIENYVNDKTKSVQLWPTSGTKPAYVYIPVEFTWSPGHKYTYTFVFGSSDSTSNGGGYDNQGKPVLTPIKCTVTVDNFKTETETEVNVKEQ
jgi:hypothetical protein